MSLVRGEAVAGKGGGRAGLAGGVWKSGPGGGVLEAVGGGEGVGRLAVLVEAQEGADAGWAGGLECGRHAGEGEEGVGGLEGREGGVGDEAVGDEVLESRGRFRGGEVLEEAREMRQRVRVAADEEGEARGAGGLGVGAGVHDLLKEGNLAHSRGGVESELGEVGEARSGEELVDEKGEAVRWGGSRGRGGRERRARRPRG